MQKFLHPFCRNFCTKNGLFHPQLSEASRGLKGPYDLPILGSSKTLLDVSELKFSSTNIQNSGFYAQLSLALVGTFLTPFLTISLRILGAFQKVVFWRSTLRTKKFLSKTGPKIKNLTRTSFNKVLEVLRFKFLWPYDQKQKKFRTQSFESENPPKPLFLDVFGGKSP